VLPPHLKTVQRGNKAERCRDIAAPVPPRVLRLRPSRSGGDGAEGPMQKIEIPDDFPLKNIVTEISPHDEMFDSPEHYIDVGLSALKLFEHAIEQGYLVEGDIREILDLPCGHGRVARVLKGRFPFAALTVCDLNRDGVDFCANRFAAAPVYSTKDFNDLELNRAFDLVWVGSLITHLDVRDTARFLRRMARGLAPAGLLIVSSSGRSVLRRLASGTAAFKVDEFSILDMVHEYYTSGYTYRNYHGMKDYGNAVISREWLETFLSKEGWTLLEFVEQGWDNHQDVSFIKKS
jgi:SAM-dependent methyltransferase